MHTATLKYTNTSVVLGCKLERHLVFKNNTREIKHSLQFKRETDHAYFHGHDQSIVFST